MNRRLLAATEVALAAPPLLGHQDPPAPVAGRPVRGVRAEGAVSFPRCLPDPTPARGLTWLPFAAVAGYQGFAVASGGRVPTVSALCTRRRTAGLAALAAVFLLHLADVAVRDATGRVQETHGTGW